MLKPCIICGKPTEWRCADCGIRQVHLSHPLVKEHIDVAICESPNCRDTHEKTCSSSN